MYRLDVRVTDNCPGRDAVIEFYRSYVVEPGDMAIELLCPDELVVLPFYSVECCLGVTFTLIQTERTARHADGHAPLPDSSSYRYAPGLGSSPVPDSRPVAFRIEARSTLAKTPLEFMTHTVNPKEAAHGPLSVWFRCLPHRSHPATVEGREYRTAKHARLLHLVVPSPGPITIRVLGSNNF